MRMFGACIFSILPCPSALLLKIGSGDFTAPANSDKRPLPRFALAVAKYASNTKHLRKERAAPTDDPFGFTSDDFPNEVSREWLDDQLDLQLYNELNSDSPNIDTVRSLLRRGARPDTPGAFNHPDEIFTPGNGFRTRAGSLVTCMTAIPSRDRWNVFDGSVTLHSFHTLHANEDINFDGNGLMTCVLRNCGRAICWQEVDLSRLFIYAFLGCGLNIRVSGYFSLFFWMGFFHILSAKLDAINSYLRSQAGAGQVCLFPFLFLSKFNTARSSPLAAFTGSLGCCLLDMLIFMAPILMSFLLCPGASMYCKVVCTCYLFFLPSLVLVERECTVQSHVYGGFFNHWYDERNIAQLLLDYGAGYIFAGELLDKDLDAIHDAFSNGVAALYSQGRVTLTKHERIALRAIEELEKDRMISVAEKMIQQPGCSRARRITSKPGHGKKRDQRKARDVLGFLRRRQMYGGSPGN